MSEQTESFNAKLLNEKMSELDGLFTEFAKVLSDLDGFVEDNVNKSPDSSAFFGDIGKRFIKLWEDNSSSFGEFHDNFSNWSQLVAAISANNLELEEETFALYKSSSANVTGNDLSVIAGSIVSNGATGAVENTPNDETTPTDGQSTTPPTEPTNNPEGQDTPDTTTSEPVVLTSGNVVERAMTDEDGNVVYEKDKFYAAYQRPDGTSFNVYVDDEYGLYALDGNNKVYLRGSMGNTITMQNFVSLGDRVFLDGEHLPNFDTSLRGVVSYGNASDFNGTIKDVNGRVLCQSNASGKIINYTTEPLETFDSGAAGTDVVFNENNVGNDIKVHDINTLGDFGKYINDEHDFVVKIAQGQDVQWDPNELPFNGVNIDTSNGPVYLKYSVSEGCYYECNNRGVIEDYAVPLKLQGFNDKFGHFN